MLRGVIRMRPATGPRKRALSFFAGCVLGGLLTSHALAQDALPMPDWFARDLGRLQIPADAVSLYARELPSGAEVLSHNPQTALRPGSTIKLVTSLLALEVLSDEPAFRTDFYLLGRAKRPLRNGQFDGDLLVRGSGDPTLDSAKLEALARRLVKRGVKVINGDIVLDTSNYPFARSDDARFFAEIEAPFSAPPAPLIVNGKTVTLLVKPLPKGAGVAVSLLPELPAVKLDTTLGFNKGKCDGAREAIELDVQGSAEQATVRVSGSYPLACGETRRIISVLSAERYFAEAFLLAYEKAGGFVSGSVRSDLKARSLGRLKPFESIPSSPLPEILREVDKHSNNLWAQLLFLRVGSVLARKPVEPQAAAASVDAWVRDNLPQALPLKTESGAGMTAGERISARGLVELLDHANRARYAKVFFDSLSLVGVDGTAGSRMLGTPVAGNARVKTGTVSDARALTGRLKSASGSEILFAILINHPRAGQALGLIDRLTERLQAGLAPRR